jgi:hypothetical protein
MTVPNRRWPKFGLRTLFAVVTIVACWLGWNAHQVRERQGLVEQFRNPSWTHGFHGIVIDLGEAAFTTGFVQVSRDSKGRIPRLWELLGAEELGDVMLLRKDLTDADLQRARTLLPECHIDVVEHPLKKAWLSSAPAPRQQSREPGGSPST